MGSHPFLRGLWAGLLSAPPEQMQRIDKKLQDFGVMNGIKYVGGYALGIVEGLWASLVGLVEAVVTLIKLPYDIGAFLADKAPELAARYGPRITDLLADGRALPERIRKTIEGFLKDPAGSLRQIGSFLDVVGNLALVQVRAMGRGVAGKTLAFLEEPWFDYGRDIGKVVGQVLFEVILAVASDAIANIVKEALTIAGRISARLVTGAAGLIKTAGRLLGEAGEWVARVARGAAGELGEMYEGVRAFLARLRTLIAELGEEGALADAGAGGGRMPIPETRPNVLESRAMKPPTRTTPTTVADLRTPKVHPSNVPKHAPAPNATLADDAAGAVKRREPFADDPDFQKNLRPEKNSQGASDAPLQDRGVESRSSQGTGLFNVDKHHVFPQERRAWFVKRGMTGANDIDNFTINLEKAAHQAEHGGGNWRLARSEKWFHEYNALVERNLDKAEAALRGRLGNPNAMLNPAEIEEEVFKILKQRNLPHDPADFVKYR